MTESPRFDRLESYEHFPLSQVIGHRGAAGYEPENTLRSVRTALERGVGLVEVDLRKCKSGELVCIHDATVDRTTNGRGRVSQMTLDEIKSLDTGKGEEIPTVHEVCDAVNRRARIVLEIKSPETTDLISGMIEDYVKTKGWNYDDFIVFSFHGGELKKLRETNPRVPIGLTLYGRLYGAVSFGKLKERRLKYAKDLNVQSVILPHGSVDKNMVDKIHRLGIEAWAYTVNKPEDTKRMKGCGIDKIFSDFPDKVGV